jgi:predicted MFS family arabinose efflux permease
VQIGDDRLGDAPKPTATARLRTTRNLPAGDAVLPAGERRIALALLTSVFAVHFLDRQLFAILIPPIKAELALSDTQLGFLSGFAFTVLFSTVGLVIARIADRADRSRVIAWSLVAFSAMTAVCGMVTTFWQLLIARIGVGAGEGGTNPASHSLIADAFPVQHRATAMAVYSIGPNLGMILAFGIGGWLAQSAGWRVAFFFAGVLGLALALVTRTMLRDPRDQLRGVRREPGPPPLDVARAILRSRTLRQLFLAATLATAAATGLVTWLPALLTRVHGLTLAHAGALLALGLGVVGAAGTYMCGRIADRASASDSRRMLVVLAMLQGVLAISLPLALLAESRIVAALLLAVPCAVIAGYIGPTLALVQGIVDPRARAFSAAILLFFVNLFGAGIGPLAVGMISDAIGGSQALRYAMLVIPLLCLWSAWHYRRAAPTLPGELRK